MRRVIAPLLLALLAGCPACPSPPEPPTPAADDRGTATTRRGKDRKADRASEWDDDEAPTGGDPFTDPGDYSAVRPTDAEVARLVPTALDAELPPVTPVEPPDALPNIVLILGCTVRKDQLSPYGAPDDVTPFLSELARHGAVFDDFLAAGPWTKVGSTAIETGRHAVNVGMVEPSPKRNDRRLPAEVTTLAEHLAARGYRTLGATANPNLNAEFGFAQGFETYQLGLPDTWKAHLSAKQLADAALAELERQQLAGDARPFFLRLMALDAHAPRAGGAELAARWTPQGTPARVGLYRHHLHRLDEGLAHLDAGLRALGYDETNTLFVVVADHGEGMNYPDHHGFGHGQYFGSSTIHLPWILRGPGVAIGQRVLGPASQVDVLPTLLGLVGRPLVDEEPVDGADHSSLVRGEARLITRPHVFVDTWFGGSNRAAVVTATHQCQQDFGSTEKQQAKGKFVPGCYDRRADPLLERPLAGRIALMDTLVSWRREREVALGIAQAEQVEVTPEVSKQLEALGYVDDE